MRLKVKGNRAELFFNDKKVLEREHDEDLHGLIGVAGIYSRGGSVITFKNLKIRKLAVDAI